jgi:hypothetical protein
MSQLAKDLVEQAGRLAALDARKPKAANIRRAISSSYYGLFHHLIDDCAQLWMGTSNADWPLASLCARAFNHGEMKAAWKEFNKTTPGDILKPLWVKFGIPQNPDIRLVAEQFVFLQELRHAADYDLNRAFTRVDALDAVNRTKRAIEAWDRLKKQNRDAARLAAIMMLLWKTLQNR